MIKDRSHHGASNEPIDPLWSRIHRFLLYTVYHDPTDLRSLILAQIILMQGILSCDTQHTCSIWSKNCEHFDFDFDMSTVNIKNICKSFSKKVAVLKWIKLLPKPILETIYYKTIIPSVLYGVVVWGSCSSALIDDIDQIHLTATRIIYNLPHNIHSASVDIMNAPHWNSIVSFYIKVHLIPKIFFTKTNLLVVWGIWAKKFLNLVESSIFYVLSKLCLKCCTTF